MRQPSLLLMILMLGCASCSSLEVFADYDSEVAFAEFHSCSWSQTASPDQAPEKSVPSPLIEARIREAIPAALARSGLEWVAQDSDLAVEFSYVNERQLSIYSEPDYFASYGYDTRYGGLGLYGSSRVYSTERQTARLQIDLIDAVSGQLVWRGTGVGPMREGLSPRESTRRIRELVNQVLAQYPPGVDR